MSIQIDRIIDKLKRFQAERDALIDILQNKEKERDFYEEYLENAIKARALVIEAGKQTQEYLKEYIEKMVTKALQSVFEENYELIADFNIKRNKPEVSFKLKIRGDILNPKDEVGGGIVDIASFVLRLVLWSIESPQSRNTILLDESFKFVHGYLDKTSILLKKLSDDLGVQFIIITQLDELTDIADRIFLVEHNGKHSVVEQVK